MFVCCFRQLPGHDWRLYRWRSCGESRCQSYWSVPSSQSAVDRRGMDSTVIGWPWPVIQRFLLFVWRWAKSKVNSYTSKCTSVYNLVRVDVLLIRTLDSRPRPTPRTSFTRPVPNSKGKVEDDHTIDRLYMHIDLAAKCKSILDKPIPWRITNRVTEAKYKQFQVGFVYAGNNYSWDLIDAGAVPIHFVKNSPDKGRNGTRSNEQKSDSYKPTWLGSWSKCLWGNKVLQVVWKHLFKPYAVSKLRLDTVHLVRERIRAKPKVDRTTAIRNFFHLDTSGREHFRPRSHLARPVTWGNNKTRVIHSDFNPKNRGQALTSLNLMVCKRPAVVLGITYL